MKMNVVLVIQGVLATLFGLAFLVVPRMGMQPFLFGGEEASATYYFLTRCFGASVIVVAVLSWAGLRLTDRYAKRIIAAAFGIWTLLTGLLFIFATASEIVTAFGWSQVGINFVLFVLYVSTIFRSDP